MYKYERKDKCIKPYSVNYKALYGKRNSIIEIDLPEKKGKRFLNSPKNKAKPSKFLKFIIISLIFAVSSVIFAIAIGFFTGRETAVDLKKFDDIILPVVMQNPEPFSENNPPRAQTVLNSSIWDAAMNKREVISDELGRIVLSESEINESANRLFNMDIDFDKVENFSEGFYVFQRNENKFLVNSLSGTDNFAPKTLNFCKKDSEIILKVGYVVPGDRFNGSMTDFSENKIEKCMQYHLKKNKNTGKYFISAVL
ncbi:MAG: hypothetical protein ACI4PR_04085 [Acutalibacteraceae bacterium]